MKTTSKTKVYAVDIDTNGQKEVKKNGELATYITSETAFNAATKKATEEKTPLPEALAIGTFSYSFAETVDEAVQLCGGSGLGEYENIEVFLGVFNYAASLRQDNEANSILTDSSYVQKEEAVDVTYAIAQKVERSKMSNEEKAVAMLAKSGFKVSVDQLRAALEAIKGQAASA